MAIFVLAVILAGFGVLLHQHIDILVTLLPAHWDAKFVRWYYPREGRVNTGVTSVPLISQIVPTKLAISEISKIFDPKGYPVHVKNILEVDQDKIMTIMTEGNKGRMMRMLDFTEWTTPHLSPSCGILKFNKMASFDDYSINHLFTNKASNHSYLYAGFETITDPVTIKAFTGLDVTQLGDYKQNNLFTSNFPHEILTASMHCAPIDSLTLQLVGTKTWFFVSPQELEKFDAIPMPTSFFLPITDDEAISKMSNMQIVKAGPGDALYFGPHWCHAVSTAAGPNLMINMRYFGNKKMFKGGPWRLALKIILRIYVSNRGTGLNPQENSLLYPVIYDDLSDYYKDCGASAAFEAIYKQAMDIVN